ncbi:hypothetical protein P8C59_000384 [Phyllachora maydis]|uniref:Xylulose kinase n=1 Tax=Phyllachora maydis TaxID=1825666 RepID=A0AAD9HX41_9PEZI|nr:hypothetical protein P8C59_000384 [Phyllachora maydis]
MEQGQGPLYLGFDLSTQQLKAIVVDSNLAVISEAKADFDADFAPAYGVSKGVLHHEAEGEVFAPVAMWLEAIDLVCARLQAKGAPLHRLRAIGGSGQQHGSVYWGRDAASRLAALRPDRSLVDQLRHALAHPHAPNWQDHSTQQECDRFDAHLGGPDRLAAVTGSAAHHRFTGPQILRLRRKLPDMYAATARISLVSSFLASVFLGQIAPIELGPVRLDGGGSMGPISSYFAKYGFSPACQIVPFTGDNPATILALPLRPLDAIVSLGTSTTFLMVTPVYKPDRSHHLFNHPCTRGHYMFMLCYKNGGLAREKVRDALPPAAPTPGDGPAAAAPGPPADPWAVFNSLVLATPPLDVGAPGDRAKLGLYFPLPEIVPNAGPGTWRYTCAARDGSDLAPADAAAWPPAADARAIVESQALSMRLRSQPLTTGPGRPRRIYLVGGGAHNAAIARVVGDVLGAREGVYRLDVGGNACALGGAYKAVWALERAEGETFDELVGSRWREEENAVQVGGRDDDDAVFPRYGHVLGAFEEMERRVLDVAARKT